MVQFFESRKLKYEIHKLCDKRWQIAEVVGDGREEHGWKFGRTTFEEVERAVLAKANALLAGGTVQAVKVMRERVRDDGFTTSSQIFFREASGGRPEAPPTVSRYDGAMAPCSAPEDLSGREAAKAIGVLLRSYLDKQFITPLELVHFLPYIRKLNDNNYTLIQGAVHQAATAQVKAGGGDLKARGKVLHDLLGAAEAKAREAMAEKNLPTIEGGDFKRFVDRMAARYDGPQLRFYVLVAIARHFQGAQSFQARLDFALDHVESEISPAMRELLDELAACCLDSSQLVMDLLGYRPNLAAALLALSALARGEAEANAVGTGAKLRTLLGAGRLPCCAGSLWDRIERELARGRPLSRSDDKQEWSLLMKTSEKLLAECPAARKAVLSDHFKLRLRRLRDASVMQD